MKVIGSRKIKNRPQITTKRLPRSGLWFWYIIFLLFLATVVYVLFFSAYLTVETVRIYGLNKVPEGPDST